MTSDPEEQRIKALVSGVSAALERYLARSDAPPDAALYQELLVAALRAYVLTAARRLGLPEALVREGRLFEPPGAALELGSVLDDQLESPAWTVGYLFEGLLARQIDASGGKRRIVLTRHRKQSGSFYTPPALARRVVESCLDGVTALPRVPRVLDPASGAGAFLLAAAEALLARGQARRAIVEQSLYGVDLSPLSVAVTEIALWLWAADPTLSPRAAGRHLVESDALLDEWRQACPEVPQALGFDLVVGNPPWIAYAGRAAQPLSPERRSALARRFSAFKGYPTLHGLFVQRAVEVAPRGVIGLLLPSPVADLDGYRPVRRALTRSHRAREPLLEFGQDAFAEVTQPCFALVAEPRAELVLFGEDAPFRLVERQRKGSAAEELRPPSALERVLGAPPLPRELFGEMGFQSRRLVTEHLFRRGEALDGHDYPLLEGKDVAEFRVGAPRLFLKPDRELLKRAGCKLRDAREYGRVCFVVRQTAKVTIAALHSGLPFRNTLLAGFEHDDYPAELVVGLLNSALYRAVHLARQRDARQATFPQVKIAHLRALPRPPGDEGALRRIAELSRRAGEDGVSAALRAALDESVFDAFSLSPAERAQVLEFVHRRAPELGHGAALDGGEPRPSATP